jgi:hypothetical protein
MRFCRGIDGRINFYIIIKAWKGNRKEIRKSSSRPSSSSRTPSSKNHPKSRKPAPSSTPPTTNSKSATRPSYWKVPERRTKGYDSVYLYLPLLTPPKTGLLTFQQH